MTLDDLDLKLRAVLRADPHIRCALAYGSRTQVPGGVRQDDKFSDLEYYVYAEPRQPVNARDLVRRATPVLLEVVNPFGTPNFVTPQLHRIELHVQELAQMPDLLGWPVVSPDLSLMLVRDDSGELAHLLQRFAAQPAWTPEPAQTTLDNVLNALVAVRGFLQRGEHLRAQEWHSLWVVGGLIRLARYTEGTAHLPASTRWAERDLSDGTLTRLNACTAGLPELETGWQHALTLASELGLQLSLDRHRELMAALSSAVSPTPALSPPSSGG